MRGVKQDLSAVDALTREASSSLAIWSSNLEQRLSNAEAYRARCVTQRPSQGDSDAGAALRTAELQQPVSLEDVDVLVRAFLRDLVPHLFTAPTMRTGAGSLGARPLVVLEHCLATAVSSLRSARVWWWRRDARRPGCSPKGAHAGRHGARRRTRVQAD